MATVNIDPQKINSATQAKAKLYVDRVDTGGVLSDIELGELCDATEAAILDGGGFGWVRVPERQILYRFWRGCIAIPERKVVLGRVDGMIAGATQLHLAPPNNQAQAAIGVVTGHFVAPWARGLRLGVAQMHEVEKWSVELDLKALKTDLRATQRHALKMFEALGYKHWGSLKRYAFVNEEWVEGHFYFKDLVK